MRARVLKLLRGLADSFWILPATVVLLLALLGLVTVDAQRWDALPDWLPSDWVYGGGETGARTLLGVVAGSTIGVAGTLFSITIAALTLASNQMGPRLLRNFMRDRGNQLTLGVMLGAFAYSLVVLRSVRGGGDDTFVPSVGVTVGLILAAGCIGLLIYFIHHVATRINVDTVMDLVHGDIRKDIRRLTQESKPEDAPEQPDWGAGTEMRMQGSGYLQQVDAAALANWAAENGTAIKLLVRPGGFVLPGAVIAQISPPVDGAEEVIRRSTALSSQAGSANDLSFSMLQLVEVAVRALSPGINDPRTAISALDRLGASLAELAPRNLRNGVVLRDGELRLLICDLTYDQLVDSMFAMIRRAAGGTPSVLLHLLHVLGEVARIERRPDRLQSLRRLAAEALEESRTTLRNEFDLQAVEAAGRTFRAAAGGAAL